MAEQRLKTEKLLVALELAVKEFEIAAVLTPEAQHRESPHNVVHDLLQCLQGESQDCCAHSHAASACAHASGDIRKALQALREAVGDAEAKRLVKAKYPRVGMLGRFLRAQGKILALALATALFTYWFVTPRKTEVGERREVRPGADRRLEEGLDAKTFHTLEEVRREAYRMQSPQEQFRELLAWAYKQDLSRGQIMKLFKQLLSREQRQTAAEQVLDHWTEEDQRKMEERQDADKQRLTEAENQGFTQGYQKGRNLW